MSQHVLDKTETGATPFVAARFAGAITGLYGDVLQGWALDIVEPGQRLVVEICIDGACVTLARADQFEPSAKSGDQFHGFAVQLRQSWLDDARHVSVRIANQNFTLEGDVRLPAPFGSEPALIASQVWHTGGLRVGGWAWDPQAPLRHVQITVRENDQVIAQATCNAHSQALAYRASSNHGFAVDLPWELADGKPHTLEIVNDLDQPLAGSPLTLCFSLEGIEGLIKKLDPAHDQKLLNLISEVAKEQSMRLPKSAGWHLYPHWFEAFQHQSPTQIPPPRGKIGILLGSRNNVELETMSLSSLKAQCEVDYMTAVGPADDIFTALQHLLDHHCDYIIPIMAGDRLAANAAALLAHLIDEGSDWAYADCDRDGVDGERSLPWFKPVWDLDLFIGADLFTPGAVFGTAVVRQALDLLTSSSPAAGLTWHHFMAGIALATEQHHAVVAHLPKVLYHRHVSAAGSPELGEHSIDRERAIGWLCEQLTPGTAVMSNPKYPALLRACWALPDELPAVSLIVPTRDQVKLLRTCVEGLLRTTDYPNLEIIVIDNQSSDPETLEYLAGLPTRGVQVLAYPHAFNYSAINNYAIAQAGGELIGLINNDIEIIDQNWLKEMVGQLSRPNVGAVGAKLLWPNRMVQHGGVVVGINGLAAHTGNCWEAGDAGYMALNQMSRRQSAVTAACLLTRRSVFEATGGLDEKAFPVAFNDVDLCLKIHETGLDLVWCAFAELVHAESASRGKDIAPEKRSRALREQSEFTNRWSWHNHCDEHYHPALSQDYLSGPYGGLVIPFNDSAVRIYRRKSTRS